jgi:hypothetical protein
MLRVLLSALIVLACAHTAYGGTTLRIVTARAEARCSEGVLVAEPQCDGCADTQRGSWRLQSGTSEATIDLQGAIQWRVRAVARGCWSAPVLVVAGETPPPVTLWPASRVEATLTPPRGGTPPASVQLRLQSFGSDAIPDTTVDCVQTNGRWSCDVPSIPLDLRLAAPEFVPHYFWGVAVPADLGTLQLRRGASVSGRAALAARGQAGPIAVVLTPDDLLGDARGGMRAMKVETNDRGFFQFGGLEEGTYGVQATKDGWSTARADGLTVAENAEAVVRSPLTLQPLATFELLLDPPLDVDDREWSVRLERLSEWGERKRIAEAAASGGRWSAEKLETGVYLVTVTGGGGVVHEHGYRVEAGMAPLPVHIGRIAVDGTVTFAGKPVAARLRFFTDIGADVWMSSGADGAFRGALPESDEPWMVDVTPNGSQDAVRLRGLGIRNGTPQAHLSLELPDGAVTGTTVDPSGKPVRATIYVARDGKREGETKSDAAGAFRIVGLDSGEITLRAVGTAGDSGLVPHRIGDAHDAAVTLVVSPRTRRRTRVVTANGRGVAGALVRILKPSLGLINDAVTGPSGEFEVSAPAQDAHVQVIVVTPGFPVKTATVALSGDDDSREIVLGRSGGRVFVPAADMRSMPTIAAPGIPPLSVYVYTDPGTGGLPRNKVPGGYVFDLEPGSYTFCADRRGDRCVTRIIAAGAEERIEFPRAAKEPEK